MPVIWTYQQGNDPKHTVCLTKQSFERNSISVFDWLSFSPDHNPFEHLWNDVKKVVSQQNITNFDKLYEKVKEAW